MDRIIISAAIDDFGFSVSARSAQAIRAGCVTATSDNGLHSACGSGGTGLLACRDLRDHASKAVEILADWELYASSAAGSRINYWRPCPAAESSAERLVQPASTFKNCR